jgi:hypothetical protein
MNQIRILTRCWFKTYPYVAHYLLPWCFETKISHITCLAYTIIYYSSILTTFNQENKLWSKSSCNFLQKEKKKPTVQFPLLRSFQTIRPNRSRSSATFRIVVVSFYAGKLVVSLRHPSSSPLKHDGPTLVLVRDCLYNVPLPLCQPSSSSTACSQIINTVLILQSRSYPVTSSEQGRTLDVT